MKRIITSASNAVDNFFGLGIDFSSIVDFQLINFKQITSNVSF